MGGYPKKQLIMTGVALLFAIIMLLEPRLLKAIVSIIFLLSIPVVLIRSLLKIRENRRIRILTNRRKIPEDSKLPVISIFIESLKFVKIYYIDYVKFFSINILLTIVSSFFIVGHSYFYIVYKISNPSLELLIFVFVILYTYSFSASAWHRFVVKGESLDYMSFFNIRVLNYMIFAMTIAVIAMIPNIIWSSVNVMFARYGMLTGNTILLTSLLTIFVSIFVLLVNSRLCIVLPARSFPEEGTVIDDIWQATFLNKSRLLVLNILYLIPTILVALVISVFTKDPKISLVIEILFNLMVTVPIVLTCLSLAYKHFFSVRGNQESVNHLTNNN
ncbi:MAG: hypothetical protein R3D71_01865 [Rickettsiales bacterium]